MPVPNAPYPSIVNHNNTAVGFSFGPGAGAAPTGYNLKRSTTPGGPYTTIQSGSSWYGGSGGNLLFVDTGLTNGTTYYYVISGTNSSGEGPNCQELPQTPAAETDAAVFIGQSAPSSIAPGATFQIRQTWHNGGTRDWAPFTNFANIIGAFPTHDTTWYGGSQPFSTTIPAGQTGTTVLTCTAPATPGLYTHQSSIGQELFTLAFSGAYSDQLVILVAAAVSNLSATPAPCAVILTWNAYPSAIRYRIYTGTTPGGEAVNPVTSTTSTTITWPAFDTSPVYFYVTAVLAAGETPASSEVSAAAIGLSAPTGITATPGINSVVTTCAPVTNATGYELTYTDGTGSYTITANSRTYTITNLPSNHTVSCHWAAYNTCATSAQSSTISTTPLALPQVRSVAAVPGDNYITLYWPAVAAAETYTIRAGTKFGPQIYDQVANQFTQGFLVPQLTYTNITDLNQRLFIQNDQSWWLTVSAVNSAEEAPARPPQVNCKPARHYKDPVNIVR